MPTLILTGADVWDGDTLRPATVVLDGAITAVLPAGAPVDAPPEAVRRDLAGHVLVPGLIDAHTHLLSSGAPDSYERELLKEGEALRALGAAKNARHALDHGVLTMRDVCTEGAGFADVALREAISRGWVEGPRLYASGPGIGVTGGYLPMGMAPGVCVPSGCATVDGVDEARRETRRQLTHGVQWIKVFADWMRPDPSTRQVREFVTFSADELRTIVEEAGRRGVRVAAHATSDAGARAAISAGAASVEHLGELSRQTLDEMAGRGVFLVPTLSVVEAFFAQAEEEAERTRWARRVERARATFALAQAAGVAWVCGTDIGCFPHAVGSRGELAWLTRYGLDDASALRAATSTAASLLGAPTLGRIAVGAAGDVCAFAGSTLSAVWTAERPALVVQGGRIVRG